MQPRIGDLAERSLGYQLRSLPTYIGNIHGAPGALNQHTTLSGTAL